MPPNTCGYGPLASSRRKSENMVRAADGMTLSTVRSTAELRTSPVIDGNPALTTAEPISQAMSRTDTTLTTAPPAASR